MAHDELVDLRMRATIKHAIATYNVHRHQIMCIRNNIPAQDRR